MYNMIMKQNGINKEEISKDISKHNQKRTKLTIMCMVYNDDGTFLVQNRLKKDWPGLTFPGGHVEDNEEITDAVIREMKEETGLELSNIEFSNYIEWNDFGDDIRHLSMLFKCKDYKGKLNSSPEGPVFFIKEEQIKDYELSNDFLEIYKRIK